MDETRPTPSVLLAAQTTQKVSFMLGLNKTSLVDQDAVKDVPSNYLDLNSLDLGGDLSSIHQDLGDFGMPANTNSTVMQPGKPENVAEVDQDLGLSFDDLLANYGDLDLDLGPQSRSGGAMNLPSLGVPHPPGGSRPTFVSGDMSNLNIFDMDDMSDLNLDMIFDSNNTDDGIEKLLKDFTTDFGQDEQISPVVFYTLVILYTLVIAIGVVGNCVILYAILSKRSMRTARNYFIVCLAFSDLMLCAMTMPLTLWEVLSRKWIFGQELEWLCQLAHSCQGTPVFLSSMAIVAIAVDRYRCIMLPEKPHFSASAALLISFAMAFASIILSVPMFITAKIKSFIEFPDIMNMENILICQDTWDGSLKVVYTVISSCAQFLLPVMLVITLYLSIYLKLKDRPQSQHAENNEKRRRTNIMIMCITVIFFVSWLPLNLFNFFMDMYPLHMKDLIAGNETVIYALLHLFGLCNALTNPILYGYLNENFRKEYKNIYRKMPWYSTSKHDGLELAVHYHVISRRKSSQGQGAVEVNRGARNSAAVVTIDRNNVNVVGPASIAQRLIFAAAAAAAAAPRTDNDDSDSNDNDDNEADTPTAEAVAKAFLQSVQDHCLAGENGNDIIDGNPEKDGSDDDSGEDKSAQLNPVRHIKENGVSGIIYIGKGGRYQHHKKHSSHNDGTNHNHSLANGDVESGYYANKSETLTIPIMDSTLAAAAANSAAAVEDGEEMGDDDDVQLLLVAARPTITKERRKSSVMSLAKRRKSSAVQKPWAKPEVRILSIESFRSNSIAQPKQQLPVQEENQALLNHQLSLEQQQPCVTNSGETKRKNRRLFSIPDVLLNATMSRSQCNNGTRAASMVPPRTRLVSVFAHQEQIRPVCAPCHPIDLEGLQETAV